MRVADDRIAAIDHVTPGGPHPVGRVERDGTVFGRAEIAGQDRVAAAEDALPVEAVEQSAQ